MCDSQRGRYGWRAVYDHVRAARFYPSRKPNGRWDIPFREQFTPRTQTETIIGDALLFEIQMGRIEQLDNTQDQCTQCPKRYNEPEGIFGHLAKKPETTTEKTIWPNSPPTFSHIVNLQKHIRYKICHNKPTLITPDIWAEVVKWNPSANMDLAPNQPRPSRKYRKKEANRTNNSLRIELLLGGIAKIPYGGWINMAMSDLSETKNKIQRNQKSHGSSSQWS